MNMEQNIKVSILVPFYNVENYVGRCVESLFTQTYQNIEYVFVNDCTPDKSMEVINEKIAQYGVADKCKIIIHEQNKGISASRNDCLDNMTGDYFLFIDSDDFIDKDMVELLVEAAVKENADISGCGYIEEYADHCVEHPQRYTNNHDEMMRAITLLTLKGVMWKLLVRSTIVTDHRDEVRFIPDRNMVDDYLFCCQIFYYAQRFAGVDRCMYHWIQYNPNNYTHTTIFAVESQAAAIRKTEEFYREKGVYEVVKDELLKRKFISKLPLLLDKECYDVNRWRNLFPESNNAWKDMRFSFGNKLLFRAANSSLYSLLQFRSLILYGIIGSFSSGLDFSIYTVLVRLLGIHYVAANCFSVLCGISTSFVLNRNYNFKVKDKTKQRFTIFLTVGLCGMLLSNMILWLCIEELHFKEIISKLLSIVLVVFFQFLLNKYLTFKS